MKNRNTQYQFVFRYVYALSAVAAIAAIAVTAALYVSERNEDRIRDRIILYHLASSAALKNLDRDTQALERLLVADASGQTPVERAAPPRNFGYGISASLYSMRGSVGRMVELQGQYDDDRFRSTLDRLSERFVSIEQLVVKPGTRNEIAASAGALRLSIEQLQRLHDIAVAESLSGIVDRVSSILRNLAIFAAILISALVLAWYLMRLLRRSLADQRRTEERLAQSQERMHHMQKLEALGQLVGGVAHDFNNLLTAILGQAGLLRKQAAGNERIQKGVQEISGAARQASSLTSQLLAFSRRQPIEPRVVDLDELVKSMEPMLERLIGEDIALEFRYDEARDAVEIDPGQMHQVILNLMVNARDAIRDGGRIALVTECVILGPDDARSEGLSPGRYIRLVVEDDGIGMDSETVDRIFEPFFTTKARGRGTGLGLATVHGIVSAANGAIRVTSRPGQGTRFEVFLPGRGRLPEASEPEPAAESAIRGTETVLVVEDEAQIRTLLKTGLSALGYQVMTASGGNDGLDACAGQPAGIDVIVSDVIMPDMNGAEFVEAALPVQPNAVVIYMSGYTDEIVLQRGIDGSEIPLVHKPFEVEELAGLIREQLDRREPEQKRA